MTSKPGRQETIVHVAVGSKNPCKIHAVQEAFKEAFYSSKVPVQIMISSYDVPSGVSDQPFGDEETKQGAKNRALSALKAAQKQSSISSAGIGDDNISIPPPHFGVGLEGGVEAETLEEQGHERKKLWCIAWMAVIGNYCRECTLCKDPSSTYDDEGRNQESSLPSATEVWGLGKTASFSLPPKITKLVLEENMELGHADDKVFNRINSKQGQGTVGVLTKSMINRDAYYVHALKLALIPFIWPEHYINDPQS